MRLLLVGDPHVTVEELGDSQALLDGVLALDKEHKPDFVVFMGDMHHNHALVRVEVTDFWLRNLTRFENSAKRVVLLLGNHDRPNDVSSSAHALQPYESVSRVISKLQYLEADQCKPSTVVAPYYHDKDQFTKDILEFPAKGLAIETLLCHQTFDGSVYENGFYAPDGADPVLVGVPKVISGHIHTKQVINWPGGSVHYIGSPRWRTVSDANENKAVVLYDTTTGDMTSFQTCHWCSPISKAIVTCADDLDSSKIPFANLSHTRLHLDIAATSNQMEALVGKVCQTYPRAKIRPIATDSKKMAVVSESEGVFEALRRFVGSYKPPFGTPSEVLQAMIAKRVANV